MENENQNPNPSTGGLKLMTIFIVVLALHVLVIGGVSAYSLLKGNQETASTETKTETMDPASTTETPSVDTCAPVMAENQESAVVAPEVTQTPAEVITPAPVVATTPVVESAPVVAAVTPKAVPMASSESYTVKSGDSLSKIARLHGMKVGELKHLNAMANDKLKVGQTLKVSTSSASTIVAAAAPAVSAPQTIPAKMTVSKSAAYTVSKGDTLTKIARQFGTTPSAIMAANKLTDARKLKIGMKLNIPSNRQEMSEQVKPTTPALQSQAAPAADFAMAK
jgi:LysM repeat protein